MICKSTWPQTRVDNSKKIINLPVQVNGKMKDLVQVEFGASQEEVLEKLKSSEKVKDLILAGVKKIIFVPNKIINLIV